MMLMQPTVSNSIWRRALVARAHTMPAAISQPLRRRWVSSSPSPSPSSSSAATTTATVDTLIVGGGPVGCSTAYHLSQLRGGDGSGIVVVERDPTYKRASATLSAGGIRQQFSLKENIQMSLYGIEFLRRSQNLLNVNVHFQEQGYLFLASKLPGAADQMRRNHAIQMESGATNIDLLSTQQLQTEFPWLNVTDLSLGSFGRSGEGWFDPWALIQGFKQTCRNMGVTFVTGEPVCSTRESGTGRVTSVRVVVLNDMNSSSSSSSSSSMDYSVHHVVNAAGAYCRDLLHLLAGPEKPLHFAFPVEPRKRSIYFFHCPKAANDIIRMPLTICPTTGVYVRPEGSPGHFLCGVSPKEEQEDRPATHDWSNTADETLFETVIWPALYERVPDYFGELKVKSSWAGLYEYNTLDQNAIIDFHPELPNVLLVNGFSGHGLQHSPASGRAAAELLHTNSFQTLDLRIFNFDRLYNKEPVLELGIV